MNYRPFSAGLMLLFSAFIAAQPHDAVEQYATCMALRTPTGYVSLTKSKLPIIDIIKQAAALNEQAESTPELTKIMNFIEKGRKFVPRNILKDALYQAARIILKNVAKLSSSTALDLLKKLNTCLTVLGLNPVDETLPVEETPAVETPTTTEAAASESVAAPVVEAVVEPTATPAVEVVAPVVEPVVTTPVVEAVVEPVVAPVPAVEVLPTTETIS